MDIGFIKNKIKTNQFRITKHATIQRIERQISVAEIKEAILNGEIIESYPEDKYSPSLLILGTTAAKKDLHVLASYSSPVWIITAYEPDKAKWIKGKTRRRQADGK